jgi:hypothetical protein
MLHGVGTLSVTSFSSILYGGRHKRVRGSIYGGMLLCCLTLSMTSFNSILQGAHGLSAPPS